MSNGPEIEVEEVEKALENGWVWPVFRRDPKTANADGRGHDWHLQGIASTEEQAIAMCADSHYIIGPIPVDMALPHNRVEWAGSYFPLGTPSKGK